MTKASAVQPSLFPRDTTTDSDHDYSEQAILFRQSNQVIPTTTYGTFGLYRYPAKFIPQVIDRVYTLFSGDCLDVLRSFPDESVHCVITSPPYWKQMEYHHDNGDGYTPLGSEEDPKEYVANLTSIFNEVKRVLRGDGSFWLNIGDKYYNKNLMGMPWRVALEMQEHGWILRNDIIWDQRKGTQSVKDRLRDVYEHVFHFVKSRKYYYADTEIRITPKARPTQVNGRIKSATGVSGVKYREQIRQSESLTADEKRAALLCLEKALEEMREGKIVDFRMTIRGNQRTYHSNNKKVSGRAKELEERGHFILKMRSHGYLPSDIWRIVPEDVWRKDTHYAVFPEELLLIPIKATCPPSGIVLDPFSGTGSTVVAAVKSGRRAIGIELSEIYNKVAENRIGEALMMGTLI